jgi:hypothetical protein
MNDPIERPAGERPVVEQASKETTRISPLRQYVRPAVVDEQPRLQWRECLAVVVLLVLCDMTIYRGHGFAGLALLFFTAPGLLAMGSARLRCGINTWLVGAMLVVLAVKLLWCGSILLVIAGFWLVAAYAAVLAGLCPYVVEVGVFASQIVLAGYEGLIHYWRCLDKRGPTVQRTKMLAVALPTIAFVVFGFLFILANPDLLKSFGKWVEWLGNELREWVFQFSPSLWEVLFWIASLWITVGLLRPLVGAMLFEKMSGNETEATERPATPSPTPLYAAFRNTLLTLIALFAIYLVFEFKTLWFREFPKGFYYSGYAHEGAAWLTVALALATVVLSLVFKGGVLHDARLPRLRRLAWLWSFENILLATAVYHRLFIYIRFNGMTSMRMVGLFGMTSVLIGFVFVIWKIISNRDFVWLVRRHLWTLALMTYLFAITPVDTIVTNYNVRRILSGDPAPSTQIDAHPIGAEGVLLLTPLLGCKDETIREGIAAMLAERQIEARKLVAEHERDGWTAFQIADRLAAQSLESAGDNWKQYTDNAARRETARRRFHDYAYQWY